MLNRVTLVGHLGKDPEVRRLENGTPVGKFSIATSESYKDANNEWQSQTEWHDIVVWRVQAEQAEKTLKKGSLVYLEGKLTHRKWTDKNGIDRYTTEIVAAMVRNLERTKSDGVGGYFPSQEPHGTQYTSATPEAVKPSLDNPMTQAVPFDVIAPSVTESANVAVAEPVGEDGLPF
ncbi:MAG: single-stranded DNA-binding protein [Saprospiraceae bacterium]|nr:single-stranded DNA-binding protein [Saprospiraceae bacterium]